ncbi:MAG: contractile injection system tape measure protein [Cytophagales bacterium]|nr:contractile injection system tape measure protein [Cytophagales bacterium]
MDYRIDKVKFDVDFYDKEDARDLQDKFFRICRNGLDRALEGVLEKYELSISIPSIELDLGDIAHRDLDNELLDLLVEKFEEALKDHLQDFHLHQSSEQFQFEALTLFLEKGLKHWSDVGKLSLLELFREVLKRSAGSLIRFMVNTRHKLTVVSRLVALIHEQDYSALIRKMRPAEASFILKFIEEVKEVNAIRAFSPATTGQQLDDWLRQLVLIDLIKTYGSAFNRRMFIERNLQGLAKQFNLSYLELLERFQQILNEDIPFNMTSTLPGIIKTISEKYQKEEAITEEEPFDKVLVFGSLIAINASLHQLLQEDFESVIEAYSGEVSVYLTRHTRTLDQVKSLVGKLKEPQLEKLIEVVEPDEHGYIQTYISGAKGIAHERLEFRSDQDMHAQIYQIVIAYLLIDRGTRFNQKAFLKYQLLEMSQATGIRYKEILHLLRESLELMGSHMSSGMLLFLKEFLSEEETKVIDEALSDEIAVDELELVKEYLKSGALPVHLRSQLHAPMTITIQELLADEQSRVDLFIFLEAEQAKMLEVMVDLKQSEFEVLIRIILMEHWALPEAKAEQFFQQLKRLERQVVYPVAYRKVVFQLLMSPTLKAGQFSQADVTTIHASEVSEMLVYQLQEYLSLPRILAHPDFENTLEFKGDRETSFSIARKRLLAAIEDTIQVSPPYEKEAIRRAFLKVQESDIETFTLLDHLKEAEVQYLFASLDKQHFQKLIEQLALGKWQALKKTLLLVVKGGGTQHQEVARFFAALVRQRNESISQVFIWINEQYTTLNLPDYYVAQIASQQQEIQAKLDLSLVETNEVRGHSEAHELLISLLNDHEADAAQKETVDTIFNQLLKKDPKTLFRLLHEISFSSVAVARYIDKLSTASIEHWIKYETGAGYQEFQSFTRNIEHFLLAVFKIDRSIHVDQNRLLAIRLMLANRVGHYAMNFDQVFRFYLQELAEHSAYKYQLVQKWLFQGLKRRYQQFSEVLEPNQLALLEEELKPPGEKSQYKEEETLELLEEPAEALSNLKVPNSGLVLIWPFFQRLFSMLGYLNEEFTFKSNVEKSRAVRLLHYICGFDWDEPEYNLTLNKILCGMPFSERMEPGLEITQEEADTAQQLLEGVIQNWDKLGQTSVVGFQQSFLQRDGFLEKEDESWKLKVEKSGIDVLIDHMPWSYASVILRWMPGAVYVEWR